MTRLVDFHTGVGLVERRLDALVAFGRRVELHGLIAALRRRARCCLLVAESRSGIPSSCAATRRGPCAARRCLSRFEIVRVHGQRARRMADASIKVADLQHAAAHNRVDGGRAASVVARSRASRKYFRAALGALRMQASPPAPWRAAAARLPPCSSRTRRSRSCSARKPRASCEAHRCVCLAPAGASGAAVWRRAGCPPS